MEDKKTLTLREFNLCGEISIHNFRTEAVGLTGDITDLLRIYLGLDTDEEIEKLIYNYPVALGEDEEDEIHYFNSKTWVEKTIYRAIEKLFKQTGYEVDFHPALVLTLFLKNRYNFINIPVDLFEKVQSPYELYQFFKTTDDSTLSSLKIKLSTSVNTNILTLDIKSYQFMKRAIEYYSNSPDGEHYIDDIKSDYAIMSGIIEKMQQVNQNNIKQAKNDFRHYFIPIVDNYYHKTITNARLRSLVIGELLTMIIPKSMVFKGNSSNIEAKADFYYRNIRKYFPKTKK
ncbi:MAG TPA: hypothetical protein VFW78_03635 [Bacteroidia bacterium]|nr:hypothetical protein [Bacteroidia bacterium]